MKRIILGTAGHIDHGKTSFIRALTGIDTDRLKEEKERGITIELGFAHFQLPSGILVGIVDVPGHERFVHHMVSGATGMDVVALFVAADEGVMPQTREHLDICRLLNIPQGLVVLTKIDLVEDPEWIELVKEDIREATAGTFLEGAPVIEVSSVTGEGIDEFVKALDRIARNIQEKPAHGPFRLPVDRVFTLKGFGTVVTGTARSGIIRTGDPLVVYPRGVSTRARTIHVHGQPVSEAGPGMRTGINLQGVEREDVCRGDVVAPPNSLIPSTLMDVELTLLPSASRPLKHGTKVRFHTGTAELLATVVALDRESINPGETAVVQLVLDNPTAVLANDRFVVRSYSPIITIGGGKILDPLPRKHRRKGKIKAAEALNRLRKLADREAILWHIEEKQTRGIGIKELQVKTAIYGRQLEAILNELENEGQIHRVPGDPIAFVHTVHFKKVQDLIMKKIAEYHRSHPLKRGISRELLATSLSSKISARMFQAALESLEKSGRVCVEQEIVRLPDHKAVLKPDEEKIRNAIERIYLDARLQPPYFKDVEDTVPGSPDQRRSILQWMLDEGILVRVKEDLIFHNEALVALKTLVVNHLKQNGELTPSQFKELTGVSRKYAIPLLEYLDREKITLRVGDVRVLRETAKSTSASD